MKYVLFICGHNAGRSQMAQALFNYRKADYPAVDRAWQAISAGTRPGDKVNPLVVQAMDEIGIEAKDVHTYFTKGLDSGFIAQHGPHIERAIVACDDKCILPQAVRKGLALEYWSLPDPHGKPMAAVRKVRDLVAAKIDTLLGELNRNPEL
ncbi:MAG: hypothetical protein HY519_02740 [Candidatus Aenigmarchaeota archaeon]|nr:hypothetical protein [Candidatus Aenigmarchaeota archaeon]